MAEIGVQCGMEADVAGRPADGAQDLAALREPVLAGRYFGERHVPWSRPSWRRSCTAG